ncbi:MAG: dephospho-CoA kinase [Elusimicrobiota bacterium]
MPKRARTLTVGLTGGIGSGKSEALKCFARAGAETLSLDDIAHELSRKGRPLHRAIVRTFGRGALDRSGAVDREALGTRVFADARQRRRLERAAHPVIRREMRRRLAAARRAVTVVDVPLLFEGGLQGNFDVTVIVTASRERRIERVRRRSGLSRSAVVRRMRAQLPERTKRRLADVRIPNDGSLRELGCAVREYQKALRLIAGGNNDSFY